MNPKSVKARILYSATALALLATFIYSHIEKDKDPRQIAYEAWLSNTLPKIQNPKLNSAELPTIKLSVTSNKDGLNWNLVLENEKNNAKIARLLEMIGESKLFSLPPSKSEELSVKIDTGSQEFSSNFSKDDLTNNAEAQAMIKLFQIYAVGADSK